MQKNERLEQITQQYSKLPEEIKNMKRWVCFNKVDKIPRNAMSGSYASCDKPFTWTTFNVAIMGCVKYGFDGLGFMLGDGIVGVDLDNHINEQAGTKPLNDAEFNTLIKECVNGINSYAEFSSSGEGVHIICKAHIPEGNRKTTTVEMYDTGRYFAMTGKVINDMPIMQREEETMAIYNKYVKGKLNEVINNNKNIDYTKKTDNGGIHFGDVLEESLDNRLSLSDNEVISKIQSSSQGVDFTQLYNGNMSKYDNNHSKADLGMCAILAFWCGKDRVQMDRIFRSSALMRDKWERKQKGTTYGWLTIDYAINSTRESYLPPVVKEPKEVVSSKIQEVSQANKIIANNNESEVVMNIAEDGEVLVKPRKIFKAYPFNDTGNAERFYDQFGSLFRWNKTNRNFMFWTGKTWVQDEGDLIAKKCADIIIGILREEIKELEQKVDEAESEEEAKKAKKLVDVAEKNMQRVSNSTGKEAMLKEVRHLHNMPCKNTDFDVDIELLNTDSGVVNLRTGEIQPFSPDLMQSKNTNCKVSYEEPKVWLKFLKDVFYRGNDEETQEIIDCIQKCLGYTLSGSTAEQCMFLLYGATGSNGKSTFSEQISRILGEYATTTPSKTLMASKFESGNKLFSLAKLRGARYVSTSETERGEKIEEATLKVMTGSDKISAAFKGKDEFDFIPLFKIWMQTNYKPVVRGTEAAIWRRFFMFPFIRTFTDKDKDKDMPNKLKAETPQILGWCIQGYKKYLEAGQKIEKPRCIEEALSEYKSEMDVVTRFINNQCSNFSNYLTSAGDLYADYKQWARDDNEYIMSQTEFSKSIVGKGYERIRRSTGYFYRGIKLNSDRKGHSFDDNDMED